MNADRDRKSENAGPSSNSYQEVGDFKLWGIFIFGLVGATVTTLALTRSSRKGAPGSAYRSSFQEDARKRCSRQRKEECEEEMERVERIRRMQSVFNRERNKYKKSYESWTDNGSGAYNQHFQRDDWYWKTEQSYRDRDRDREAPPSTNNFTYSLFQHYLVLGLDSRSRTKPYSDSEIKIAFQAKAKQFHPDQNQHNKEAAEAKFKQVMGSYEAIKQERRSNHL